MNLRTLLWLTVLLAAVAAQEGPRFLVSGNLAEDLEGLPIQNVRVVLTANGLVAAEGATDREGRFKIAVPSGSYSLLAEKSGYFSPAPIPVQVTGENRNDITATLVKSRSIRGRVTYSDGEPVEKGAVAALVYKNSRRVPYRIAFTENDGSFYLSGLEPGRYTIAIDPSTFSRPEDTHLGATAYFPPLDSTGPASTIDLRKRETSSIGEIVLADRAGASIEGRVLTSSVVPRGTRVTVNLSLTAETAIPFATATVSAGEQFRIPRVPLGTYWLYGIAQSERPFVFGIQALRMATTDLRTDIAAPEFLPAIDGVVELEQAGRVVPVSRVELRVTGNLDLNAMPWASTGQDGRFVTPVLAADSSADSPRYRLRLRNLPMDTYVSLVTQGTSVLPDPFEVSAGRGAVRVALAKDGGTIKGRIVRDGPRTPFEFIILAPSNRSAIHSFRTATASRDGTFEIRGIPPGEYRLFVFADEEQYSGDEALRVFSDKALPLTVEKGSQLQLEVREVLR